MLFAAPIAIGMCIDALLGWPNKVYRRIGHPVTWIGSLIAGCEARWNDATASDQRRLLLGGVTVLIVVGVTVCIAVIITSALPAGWLGAVLTGVLAWPFLALKSMHQHIAAVAKPLADRDIAAARQAVSMIVGRDPTQLDAAGIARATLESLAENTSDGVIAPVFWGVLLGLPGLAGYKAINTLDSMIGHRNSRYEHFGKVAARLDDLVNLIPARLTGMMFACVTAHPRRAMQVMWRDAAQHRSPNAGWPEAAMAGALGVRLSGPRVYGDRRVEEPWVNDGAPDPDPTAIFRGLALYWRAMGLSASLLVLLAVA